jgi:alkylated DNA repair dioxygenase AlkB
MTIHLHLAWSTIDQHSRERTVIQQIKVKAPSISGLSHYSNYITSQQEVELAADIDAQPWNTTWKRRRQPYGQSYGDSAELRPAIPHWAEFLIVRLVSEGISETPFDQMLVNEYLPGQGIALHRDYEPFDRTAVSLSLLSACAMDFRHVKSGRRESLLLEPRSLRFDCLSNKIRLDRRRENDLVLTGHCADCVLRMQDLLFTKLGSAYLETE